MRKLSAINKVSNRGKKNSTKRSLTDDSRN
jgi:hypothetical protein